MLTQCQHYIGLVAKIDGNLGMFMFMIKVLVASVGCLHLWHWHSINQVNRSTLTFLVFPISCCRPAKLCTTTMESSTATMESSSSATQPIAAQVENDDEDHYTSSPFEDELDGFSPRPETYLSDKDTKKKMVDVTDDPYYLPWTKKKPAIGPKTFKHRTRRYIYKTDESSDSETEDFFRVTIKPGVGPTSWRQRHECDSREELRDYWMDRFDGFKASNKRTLRKFFVSCLSFQITNFVILSPIF